MQKPTRIQRPTIRLRVEIIGQFARIVQLPRARVVPLENKSIGFTKWLFFLLLPAGLAVTAAHTVLFATSAVHLETLAIAFTIVRETALNPDLTDFDLN